MTVCPDRALLGAAVDEGLDSAPEVLAHLVECAACRAAIATLVDEDSEQTTIARYVITGQLGQGARGTVYEAYDPELDRTVAIKVLSGLPGRHESINREAQSMARVDHPNVVPIYDVGRTERGPYVAMKAVIGASLSNWCVESDLTSNQSLELIRSAAMGLEAIHAKGTLHRDIKPENILVSEGHVYVSDFGLATTDDVDLTARRAEWDDLGLSDISETGELAGTPVYMAPELFDGQPASMASDQYALAATAYEVLTGTRPFHGETLAEFVRAQAQPLETDPLRRVGLSRSQVRAFEIALRPNPKERFESVAMFAEHLKPKRSRKGLFALGAVAAAGAAAGLFVVSSSWGDTAKRATESCLESSKQWTSFWSSSKRSAINARFDGHAYAELVPGLERQLGRLVSEVQSVWADSCTATFREGGQTARAHNYIERCLAEEVAAATRLVSYLENTDPKKIASTTILGASGLSVRECASSAYATRYVDLAPTEHEAVSDYAIDVDEAVFAIDAEEPSRAAGILAKWSRRAEGSELWTARISVTNARLANHAGEAADAERHARAALGTQSLGNHYRFRAWLQLFHSLVKQRKFEQAQLAEVSLQEQLHKLGEPNFARAQMREAQMAAAMGQGKYDEAAAFALEAADGFERAGDPQSAAESLLFAVLTSSSRGKKSDANRYLARAESLLTGSDGIYSKEYLATLRFRTKLADASEALIWAAKTRKHLQKLGEFDSVTPATGVTSWLVVSTAFGRNAQWTDAVSAAQEAVRWAERAPSRLAPLVKAKSALGITLVRRGDLATGRNVLRDLMPLARQLKNPMGISVGLMLGNFEEEGGSDEKALALYTEMLALATAGNYQPIVAQAQVFLGVYHAGHGRPERARALLEKSVAGGRAGGSLLGEAYFSLAALNSTRSSEARRLANLALPLLTPCEGKESQAPRCARTLKRVRSMLATK